MKNYSARILLLVVSLALSALSAFSQTNRVTTKPTIWIGIVELHLGMPRDVVISKLAENSKVTKIQGGSSDDWIVAEKNHPETSEGQVRFHEGKLTWASRDWTQGDEDAYTFAKVLWGAMTQMNSEGQQSCFFDVPTSSSPQMEAHVKRFYCGAKRIEILMMDVLNGPMKGHNVSITEVLSSEKGH